MGNANINFDFQNLQFCQFEQKKNNIKLPVCNEICPDEAEEKSSPGTLENRGRSEGWCPSGKYFAETGKIGCLRR